MALDATISLLEKQNTILESISTQLQNQQNAVRASKLADKEDADKNRALMERIASSLGGGRGAAPAADSGGGETKKGGILGGLLAGAIGVVGSIGGILGAKSPLGLAVTKFKQSGVAKTFVSIFEKIKGFFGKEGGARKVLERIKNAKPILKNGLKFLGRIFGRVFAIFTAITAFGDAKDKFNETEGDFTTKLSAALKEFGASVLNAIFGWIPTLAGHVLEFFGAPEWLTDMLKEFDLKAEIKLLVDTLSLMLEDAIMFFMDGSFTKMFTEDIPNAIGEFFGKIGDWFNENVIAPIRDFIDNNEAIQTAIVGFKILMNAFKAIPTFIENFIFNIVNAVKGFTADIVSTLDGIKLGGQTVNLLGYKKTLPEFSMGKVIPESIRTFVKAPDLETKEVNLMEGVDMTKLQNIRAGIINEPPGAATQPVVINQISNDNRSTISAPTSNTSVAAQTEAVERQPRQRRSGVGSRATPYGF
jgi:hypothetical protein